MKQTYRGLVDISVPTNNIRNIESEHIENFIVYSQELGLKNSTINSRIRAGRTFLKYCLQKGYVNNNPYDNIQSLKTRHVVGATLNKKQLKKLLNAPDITTFIGLRDLSIMLTFVSTGIRLTELTSLHLQDVSFDGKGAINVNRAKNRYGRRIPMTKRLRTVLRAYIAERGVLDHDYLFVSVENQPINGRTIQDRLKYYGEITGVSNEVQVSPHVFRRTFARLKVEAGTNLFVIQSYMGHSSLEMLKRYVQIYGKDLEKSIEDGFDDI